MKISAIFRRDWPLAVLVGSLFVALFWWDLWLGISFPFDLDIHSEYLPLQSFLQEARATGQSLGQTVAWNPYSGLGVAALADGHMGAYYFPSYFLSLFSDLSHGIGPFFCLHQLLAFLGAFFFSRKMSLSKPSSVLAAIAFTYGGYLLAITSNYLYMLGISYFPLLCLLAIQLKESKDLAQQLRSSIIFALALSLQLFTGAFPIFFNSLVGLLLLYAFYQPKEKRSLFAPSLARLAFAIFLFSLFSAAQLLPTLEQISLSVFSRGVDYSYMVSNSLSPRLLLSFWFPYIWGVINPLNDSYQSQYNESIQGFFDFDELHNYLGLLPLALLLVVPVRLSWRSRVKPLWIMAGASLLLALGGYVPWLYQVLAHLPGFNFFKDPAKWSFVLAFALSVIAGASADFWTRESAQISRRRSLAAFAFCLLVPIVLFLLGRFGVTETEWARLNALVELPNCQRGTATGWQCGFFANVTPLAYYLIAFALAATALALTYKRGRVFVIILVALTFADLFLVEKTAFPLTTSSFYKHEREHLTPLKQDSALYRSMSGAISERESWGLDYLHSDVPLIHRVRSTTTTTPFLLKSHQLLLTKLEDLGIEDLSRLKVRGETTFIKNFLDAIAVKYLVEKSEDGKPVVLTRESAVPRFYFSKEIETSPTDTASLESFLARCRLGPCYGPVLTVDHASPATVQAIETARVAEEAASQRTAAGEVEILSETPTHLRLKISTPVPAVLVYTDQNHPSWHATLNGEKVDVLTANGLFKAVALPALSDATLEFKFESWAIEVGKWISLMSVSLAILAWLAMRRRTHPDG